MLELLMRLFEQIMFLTGFVGGSAAFPKALSAEEERKYLEMYAGGDINAKNILIEHNLRLVAHITRKYSSESNSEDLISIGIIGLIKGINTFNHQKNRKLSAYISRCIENEILMHLRSSKKLSNEVSLDETIGTDKEGNSLTFADILPSDGGDIIENLSLKMTSASLYKAIDKVLNNVEKDIIVWRYGLYGNERLAQREVATKLNISRSYVSRIEKRALNKLADELKKHNIE